MADHDPRAAEVLAEAWADSEQYVRETALEPLTDHGLTVVDAGHLDRLRELVQKAYVEALDSCGRDSSTTESISAIGTLLDVLDRKEQTDG